MRYREPVQRLLQRRLEASPQAKARTELVETLPLLSRTAPQSRSRHHGLRSLRHAVSQQSPNRRTPDCNTHRSPQSQQIGARLLRLLDEDLPGARLPRLLDEDLQGRKFSHPWHPRPQNASEAHPPHSLDKAPHSLDLRHRRPYKLLGKLKAQSLRSLGEVLHSRSLRLHQSLQFRRIQIGLRVPSLPRLNEQHSGVRRVT